MDPSKTGQNPTHPSGQLSSQFTDTPSLQQHQISPARSHETKNRQDSLTKALGWFSVGLGIAQIVAPRTISRMAGLGHSPILVRAVGLREIASGVGILNDRNPSGWLWSRVAGDAMDLALLGNAARSSGIKGKRAVVAAAAVAGVTALDLLSSVQHENSEEGLFTGTVSVEKSVTINHRTPDECYRFWRSFENFPRFMKHLESVQVLDSKRSHWKAKAPAGTTIEWDAEIVGDNAGNFLAWRSIEGADIDNAGIVRFEPAPGKRGTIVRLQIRYNPPGGKAGALVAKLFGEEPAIQVDDDLRCFKQLLETGEVTATEVQPSGPRSTFS
ncbi:MAG: SRPBCC family protein [Burkholderiaceae bacterium]